jgi:hypothetical protein
MSFLAGMEEDMTRKALCLTVGVAILLCSAFGQASAQCEFTILAKTGDTIGGKTLTDIVYTKPGLTNLGTVVFNASYSGGSGIFTQNGLVVKTGNVIDGLTLTGFDANLANNVASINDNGEIAFFASFSDGTKAIVMATPIPEPATLALPAIGAWDGGDLEPREVINCLLRF